MAAIFISIRSLNFVRIVRHISLLTASLSVLFAISGSVDASDGNYFYPKELGYGSLNALNGVNLDDAQVAIEMNFDRLSKSKNSEFKVKLDFLSDAASAAKLIAQKKIHALSITGIDFLLLQSLAAVTPLVVASRLSESPLEPYVLLSSKEMTLDQLATLDQRRLIVDHNHRWDISRIWLDTALHEKGYTRSTKFFTSIQTETKSLRMILPVFFGQAEACLVPKSAYDTMVELNPQVGQKLKTLIRSPGFVKNLICVADYLDPELVDNIKVSLLNMHMTDEGRQLMMIFQLRRNFPFKSEYLTETARIFEKYREIDRSLSVGAMGKH